MSVCAEPPSPVIPSTCLVTGQCHYTTFDFAFFDYPGTCKVNLASSCSSDVTLPAFGVYARNAERPRLLPVYIELVFNETTIRLAASGSTTNVVPVDVTV